MDSPTTNHPASPAPVKADRIAELRALLDYEGSLRDARRLVVRWNRMFATHGDAKEAGRG